MRGKSLLGIGVLALFGGCQACSECTDFSSPVKNTAPGEIYAGTLLPAGQPVVPQVLPPPGIGAGETIIEQPTPTPALQYNGMP
jgi:hypothetical protein